jgi:hypothetical protein
MPEGRGRRVGDEEGPPVLPIRLKTLLLLFGACAMGFGFETGADFSRRPNL